MGDLVNCVYLRYPFADYWFTFFLAVSLPSPPPAHANEPPAGKSLAVKFVYILMESDVRIVDDSWFMMVYLQFPTKIHLLLLRQAAAHRLLMQRPPHHQVATHRRIILRLLMDTGMVTIITMDKNHLRTATFHQLVAFTTPLLHLLPDILTTLQAAVAVAVLGVLLVSHRLHLLSHL